MEMRFGVIGLGSMGKRRVRCLKYLGYTSIVGFDPREDRAKEAKQKYGIECTTNLEDFLKQNLGFWIISTPPDIHHIYMRIAAEKGIPCFIEASVIDTGMEDFIRLTNKKKNGFYPSCTFLFHPAIQLIKKLIGQEKIGQITNVLYHSGQYLPDWHTYEKVSDYYVSKKETGGAREIVPFELTWLTKIFGFPEKIAGFYKKTIDIPGADSIEDTYNILASYPKMILNLSVDVVSRYATRKILINGELGQITWNWEDNIVNLYSAASGMWEALEYEQMPAVDGYNKNITEGMYIEEINSFINACQSEKIYPNTLLDDYRVLKLLDSAEDSATTGQIKKDEDWNINIG
jgi:predicted dehydrogenase